MRVYKNVYGRMKNGCVEKNGSKLRAVAIKINEYHKDNLYKFIFVLMLFSNCMKLSGSKKIPIIDFVIQTYNLDF